MADAVASIIGIAILIALLVFSFIGVATTKIINDCEAQLTLRSAHCEIVAVPINDVPAASGEE